MPDHPALSVEDDLDEALVPARTGEFIFYQRMRESFRIFLGPGDFPFIARLCAYGNTAHAHTQGMDSHGVYCFRSHLLAHV